jgi:DNA-binding response OmpR family regulator
MSATHRILLVDVDHEILHAASLRLRAAGYETLMASDGSAGVASAVAHHPDAIVLDVQMPVTDGLAALAALQSDESTRHIPVVMLSASIFTRQAALDAGAQYFLKKPYEGKHLVKAVETALRN